MKTTARRRLAAAAVLIGACAGASLTWAQSYPDKPVRIIVPTSAGGTTDAIARIYAQALSPRLGQPVLIENRPGAGAQIGIDATAKAAPDGYTLLLSSNSILPVLKKVPPYDPAKDFSPVTLVARTPLVYAVHAKVPTTTMAEFIAYAKARPDAVRYGSAGIGSALHVAGELLAMVANIRMTHVPYKGGGPMMTDVIGGQIEMVPTSAEFAKRFMDSGQLKSLAQTGTTRFPLLPGVPTTAELGMAEVDTVSWFGLFAPPRLPQAIAARVAAEVAVIAVQPQLMQRINEVGGVTEVMTPAEFTKFVAAENTKWSRVVRDLKIPLEP